MRTFLTTVAILLAMPIATFAQTPPVKNPTGVKFKCVDHAQDTGHEIDIVNNSGAVIQTINGGDPVADAAGDVTVNINVQPITFGSYTIKVRATAGAVKSADSTPSDVWERVPGAPSKPTVQ